uniref:Serine/threonine-protein phosphatase 2A regulatory subunit B'' subunit alpha isoform X2 n=1 Tax=Geotrypetes seraphini TaxID=260995 RepID=A0A6P8S5Z1_GEOSA|nr:serine/threonine-protein phosphatase 2A regulatory subunit B'' subunit alpha isoform X2 [Geotrypetes seraphini]
MAAPYSLVISTVNSYGSVMIDQHFQQTVHFCTGNCQVSKYDLDCTVAHHSVCVQLMCVPQIHATGSWFTGVSHKHPASENGLSSVRSEDYYHILSSVSRIKKGAVLQGTSMPKNITGEAINLASGKMKEFSFEKLKSSTGNHVTYRKGRKVQPESFIQKSSDFDLNYGDDEKSLSIGLLQGSQMEKKGLEQNMNTVASLYLQCSSEEKLIAQILEKHKLDNSSSEKDIKMCLDILLKCSEDLKKCTDIIKQCIKKKSVRQTGSNSDDGSSGSDCFASPDMIYMNVMARLSSYLKKLPFELEHSSSGCTEPSELVGSLYSLQQTPFSLIFGHEQPPKYEDVVQSPPSEKSLPPFIVESQASPHVRTDRKANDTPITCSRSLTDCMQQSHSRALKFTHTLSQSADDTEIFSSSASFFRSCEKRSNDSIESLSIEEELDWDKNKKKFREGFPVIRPKSGRREEFPSNFGVDYGSITSGVAGKDSLFFSDSISLKEDSKTDHFLVKAAEEDTGECTKSRDCKEIERLLLDLENFSERIENTLTASPVKESIPSLLNKGKTSFPVRKDSSSSILKMKETKHKTEEEEDRTFLLRILESIEDFAQELVEFRKGKGILSKGKEVMYIIQETLSPTSQSQSITHQSHAWSGTRDLSPTLLIQQTPEVIQVQNKQEKKLEMLPPAILPAAVSPLSPTLPPNETLVNASVAISIPRFYFPKGLPASFTSLKGTITKIEAAFTDFEDEKADICDMGKIAKASGCPLYWKAPMFNAAGGENTGFVSVHSFIAMWKKLLQMCHDDTSRFLYLLAKPGSNCLEQEDFIPLLQDIIDTHPGLRFLKNAPEFHSRYITTVIQRIFYTVNRSWSGRITLTELRRSNFLQTLALLEEEEDINQITDYFSYEHFYVIYCKFWELDTDHDLYIDQKDLARYNDHASSNRIIERIFSGAVTRGNTVQKEGQMSYADFVWFLISEEDKKTPTSVEYWYRCMDLDGDGILSMYELEYFYEEQYQKMEAMGIEPLPFHDLLCQMLDLVKPEFDGRITLRDLKRCRMAHIFYDTYFSLEKYLDHEQRDPFTLQKDTENDGPELSEWDRYAAEEYELLVAKESANDPLWEE